MIKIGLVAPFEGTYRSIGYDAIYAARLAISEINAAGGVGGWQLELVAYDDRADAQSASIVAQNLAIDPDVVAVIGHYRQTTTEAAVTTYTDAGMPLLTIGSWLSSTQAVWQLAPSFDILTEYRGSVEATLSPTDTVYLWHNVPIAVSSDTMYCITPYPLPYDVADTADWQHAYQSIGPHVPAPSHYALPTYEVMYLLAQAIAVASQDASPTRANVGMALSGVRCEGFLGTITWDKNGYWATPRMYTYRQQGEAVSLLP